MKGKNSFLSSSGMRFLFTSPRVSGELKEAQKKCVYYVEEQLSIRISRAQQGNMLTASFPIYEFNVVSFIKMGCTINYFPIKRKMGQPVADQSCSHHIPPGQQ